MINFIDFKDIHKFSKDIKTQKLYFFNDIKASPNTINSGGYDKQPFFIEKNNESIILFFNTEIEQYVRYFADAMSKKINKSPSFSYTLNPENLKSIEWTNNDGERYETLSNSDRISNLKFYE